MAMPDPLQAAIDFHRGGQLDHAEAAYRQILSQNPREVRALHLLGTLLMARRRPSEAVQVLRHASSVAPQSPDVHLALGDALRLCGDAAGAEAAVRKSISIRPLFPQAHNTLGLTLVAQQKLESAIIAWQKAIQLKPDYAESHANLGAALAQLKKPSEAAPVLRRAVELNPNFAAAHNNLANVLDELEDTDGAIEHWERAIELAPNYFDALVNLGKTRQRRGEHQRAMELFDRSIALRPTDPDARFLRGLALLTHGRLTEGFTDYAYRMQVKELNIDPRAFTQPAWDGSKQLDKVVLLRAEQGFGDTIQFIRYADQVHDLCGQVVLECQTELAELMGSVRGIDVVAVRNQGLPYFDVQCPLLDLPRLLGTTLETVPAAVPYMKADGPRVDLWAGILSSDPPGKRVGLVWSGNPQHGNDKNRSMALKDFDSLADVPGITWFSLQKGPAAQQLADSTLKLRPVDHTARLTDFSETAALISNLDLVITVDTSIAHLAGALGKPIWVLLPFAPDWRWMVERADSPWYPTARLWRQPVAGDWGSVITGVAAALHSG